ncbi:MAG: hypothetical protein J6M05_02695 [Cardiobacteriaceae bacterium]|nr:hypothetical protein [Cardiobacteriaceae bacterium]
MFKKLSLFLLAVFFTVNCYSDNGIITVEERCQIAKENLELLNNPNKQVYIREDGKLRALYYREILAQRAENQEIITKFCSQRVEERTSDSEKYETRQVALPSPLNALRNAIIAGKIEEIITAVEIANIDQKIADRIIALAEKNDFDGALSELDNIDKNGKNNSSTVGNSSTNSGWNISIGGGFSGQGGGGGNNRSPQDNINAILATATVVSAKNSLRQYSKTGGYKKAQQDFYSLNPSNLQTRSNGTITGKLPDGRNVNVRSFSKGTPTEEGLPTLEIQNSSSSVIKIRYTEK